MTVRALVVDDSPTMRAIITSVLSSDPGIEIVGTASCAQEARQMVKTLDPDVMTLDIEMPGLNGLEFLEKVMRLRPMPVVMLSTLTTAGSDATLTALELGAIDCFDKAVLRQSLTNGREQEFVSLVRAAAGGRVRRLTAPVAIAPVGKAAAAPRTYRPRDGMMIAIGSSTGGVEALIEVMKSFPANCPPTVIVQHMRADYTSGFAERLNRLSAPTVEEARPGAVLSVGKVYLAPGGIHLQVAGASQVRFCRLLEGERFSGHRPSVDILFKSVARVAGARAAAAILTGMGHDGAAGLLAMREAGAATFGQDRATSVVYGMPAVAHEMGAVQQQLPLHEIAPRLLKACAA